MEIIFNIFVLEYIISQNGIFALNGYRGSKEERTQKKGENNIYSVIYFSLLNIFLYILRTILNLLINYF